MNLRLFIANRLLATSRSGVSGGIVRIAVISVVIGLAVMIVSVAIVIGFKQQIREKVIGFAAHIQIEALDNTASWEVNPIDRNQDFVPQVLQMDGVQHIQGVANKAGIIKTDEQIQGIVLKGVGADYNWTYLQNKIIAGRMVSFHDTARSNDILISNALASKLVLKAGDDLRVWFISSDDAQVRGRRFTIAGIYETGLTEFDEMFIFGDIGHVQRLNGWSADEVGHFEVQIADINRLDEIGNRIYFSIPINLRAYTARESYPHIFDWLDLQDMNVIVIILLMVLVAGITMVSTLLIIILERTPMIGMLKAMGSNNRLIREIFLMHALSILVRGLIWGNILGIGFCLVQDYTGLLKLPSESYYLSEVPVYLNFVNVLLINLGTILLWFMMMLIPTAIISRITPAKAIRFA
jgi:lipoprotein-releasing system permease protein